MKHVDTLEGVSVGDEFVCRQTNPYGWSEGLAVVKCTSVSAKQCVIGEWKYRIADARGIGGSTYHRPPYLMVVDDEKLEVIRQTAELRSMRRKLSATSWLNDVPADVIRAVHKLVTEAEQAATDKEP